MEFVYAAPLSLHLQRGAGDAAFTVSERARSRLLADLLTGHGTRPHSSFSTELTERRDSIRDQLDQAYAANASKEQRSELETALAALDQQIDLVDPAYAQLVSAVPLTAVEVCHPSGPLHYLPIGALTADPIGPPPLLVQGRRVVYAPSATVLFNYCHRRARSTQHGTLAVAPKDSQLRFTYGAARNIASGKTAIS